jgi:hypothetical protein
MRAESRMTASVANKDGDQPQTPGSDPQLASIFELGRLMTLPPKDLIARIKTHSARGMPSHRQAPPALPRSLPAFEESETGEDRHGHAAPMPSEAHVSTEGAQDDEARLQWIRQKVPAAILGGIVALALLVMMVVGLDEWLHPARTPNQNSATTARDAVAQEPMLSSQGETQPARAGKTIEAPAPVTAARRPSDTVAESQSASEEKALEEALQRSVKKLEEARQRIDKALEQARSRIERGDVVGARILLLSIEDDPNGLVSYALAETYDPNILAAWGARDAVADVGKAKALYGEALDLGVSRARQRLEALR